MRLVSWVWFYYVVLGFLMAGGLSLVLYLVKKYTLKLKWFEWASVVVNLLIFMFMGQTFIASFQEYEPRAAWLTLVFMGLPMAILIAVTVRSIRSRLE